MAGLMRRVSMRVPIMAIPVILLGGTLSAAPVQAQTYDPAYPVCLQVYTGGFMDYYFECAYTNMAQCQASASGRSASCVVNPYYAGKGKSPARRKRVY
jgi:Protein of unknown function (DUF3551)